jgi:hypothetical protein
MIMSGQRQVVIRSVAAGLLLAALLTVAVLLVHKTEDLGCTSCDQRHRRLANQGTTDENPQTSLVPHQSQRDVSQ